MCDPALLKGPNTWPPRPSLAIQLGQSAVQWIHQTRRQTCYILCRLLSWKWRSIVIPLNWESTVILAVWETTLSPSSAPSIEDAGISKFRHSSAKKKPFGGLLKVIVAILVFPFGLIASYSKWTHWPSSYRVLERTE